jgi:hypothetical protein
MALDEFWFLLNADHERIWFAPGEALLDRDRHTIQSLKLMLTFAWGVTWFREVKLLANGGTFNACYYIGEILRSS